MAHLIEMLVLFGITTLFAYIIVPLGVIAIGGFLTLAGLFSTSKSSGSASFEAGGLRISWTGAAGIGAILAGIILIATHSGSAGT